MRIFTRACLYVIATGGALLLTSVLASSSQDQNEKHTAPTSSASPIPTTVSTLASKRPELFPYLLASSTCDGPLKITYMKCPACPAGYRQDKAQSKCEQKLDIEGKSCGTIMCEQCLCEKLAS